MKKILSLILTLLVSLTSMTCLVHAGVEDYNYNVTYDLGDNIQKVSEGALDYGYQIELKPINNYLMPNTVEVKIAGEKDPLVQCTSTNVPAGCSYTYHRETRDKNSTLLIYSKNEKKDIIVEAEGVTFNVKYYILDGETSVNNLFTNVRDNNYISWTSGNDYTNTFEIANNNDFGMYLLPEPDPNSDDIIVEADGTPLKMCTGDTITESCDYTYKNNLSDQTYDSMLKNKQHGKLVIDGDYYGKDVVVTINLSRLSRTVKGTINEYGYFDNNTKTTNIKEAEFDKAYKVDKGYTTYINTYAYSKLPESIEVYTHKAVRDPYSEAYWQKVDVNDKYTYDSKAGEVTFNSNIFDYNSEFLIKAEPVLRTDMSIKASVCNGSIKGATGKDSSGCSLYEAKDGMYGKDVTIRFSKNDGTSYPTKDEISVTVDGKKFTGFTYEDGVITIKGNDVKGDIKISATCAYPPAIVTCEDANGKGWIWSETKKACVYKVSNTSTK